MNRFAAFVLATTVSIGVFAGTADSEPRTYTIDKSHSEIGFDVRHFFNKTPGRFNDYTGTIVFDEANLAASTVEVAINDSSVYTGNDKRDGHLRSADFFWHEKHPQITFKSTKVIPGSGKERFQVAGDLSIRGITKPVILDVEFLGGAPIKLKGDEGQPDFDLGHQVGFNATTKVNRKDFGIVWNKVMDTGGVMLGDDVNIRLNMALVSRPKAPPAGQAQAAAPKK